MFQPTDRQIRELASSRPALRRDVRSSLQQHRSDPVFLLEDPIQGRFFRVGLREQAFILRLDGTATVAAIVASLAATEKEHALTEQECFAVLRWLAESGLLVSTGNEAASGAAERVRRRWMPGQIVGRLFFLRLRLGNPDRFLGWLERWLGWTLTVPALLGWGIVIVWGAWSVAMESERFLGDARKMVTAGDWILPVVVWVFLKTVHECWHGIACKRFGGVVPETGVSLLLFVTPLPYVDVSASLRFGSRWQRIVVAAAGMYVELFVAALMALIWAHLEPGPAASMAHAGVLMGSIFTIAFNANPLMRFDGYYILSDLLDIPNLQGRAQICFAQWVRRWLLGIREESEPLEASQNALAVFGFAAWIWRIVVWFGLFLGCSQFLRGAGFLLALFAALGLGIGWGLQTSGKLAKLALHEGVSRVRLLRRPAILMACVLLVGTGWRVQDSVRVPGVMEFGERSIVRTDCPGFVREIYTHSGAEVEAGALLVRLENRDQEKLRGQLRNDLERSRIRSRAFYREENLAAYQEEQETIGSLEQQLAEIEQYLATLEVRAPFSGRIHAPGLDNRLGAYLKTGAEILTVYTMDAPRVKLAIPQNEVGFFARAQPNFVTVRTPGGAYPGRMEQIQSGTSRQVPHPALAAVNGGPLTVLPAAVGVQPGPRSGQDPVSNPWVLERGALIAVVRLGVDASKLRDGALVWARVSASGRRSVFAVCWEIGRNWVGRRLRAAELE